MNRFVAATAGRIHFRLPRRLRPMQAIPPRRRHIVNQVCAACHGADGNSPLPMNPSLAGQHAEYLFKQLNEFKSGTRNNPVMMGMVANLSAEDMRNLAAYYAAQKPDTDGGEGQGPGRRRAASSIAAAMPSNGVAACAGCHSPNGAGIPAQYPRLAGQHPDYVARPIEGFPHRRTRQRSEQDDARDRGQTHRQGHGRARRIHLRPALDRPAGFTAPTFTERCLRRLDWSRRFRSVAMGGGNKSRFECRWREVHALPRAWRGRIG